MHEHAGTAAVEGEQKKRREEGAGAARVVSNVCPGGRQPSRENAHLCLSPLPSVAARDSLGLSASDVSSARLAHSLSAISPSLLSVLSRGSQHAGPHLWRRYKRALHVTCRFPPAAARRPARGPRPSPAAACGA